MIRFLFVCLIIAGPAIVGAQTDEFRIRLFSGIDTTPPTTPVIQTVVPVSTSQIDVTWDPVTDDVYVAGYRVYRNSVFLGTTTVTNYIDTGLDPATTYAYTVDAFDLSYSFSTTSAAVSTTTLSLPLVPTSSPMVSEPQATRVLTVDQHQVIVDKNNARVIFSSWSPTQYVFRFGRTVDYELGTISGDVFRTNHQISLTELIPGTQYFYEITLLSPRGNQRVAVSDTFRTNPSLISDRLVGVYHVEAKTTDRDVHLSWRIPPVPYQSIRIVRNHLNYPLHQHDGVVVYEGGATEFTDKNVFLQQGSYYYAIFLVGVDGQISAPAVVFVTPTQNTLDASTMVPPRVIDQESHASNSKDDISLQTSGDETILQPSDIYITQNGKSASLANISTLVTGETVTVSIPREALPRHLKTIILNVQQPTNHLFVTSYLLTLDSNSENYVARFLSSEVAGQGRLTIEVFDYERASVRRISRVVTYLAAQSESSFKLPVIVTILFLLSGAVWVWILLYRRRREDNQ